MDFFYDFWFSPEQYDVFVFSFGYLVGFLILFLSSIAFTSLFFLWLGKATDSFSTMGKWILFGLINSMVIIIGSVSIIGFKLGENVVLSDIPVETWIFSVVNGLIYGMLFYLLFSLILKRYSKYAKYVPF